MPWNIGLDDNDFKILNATNSTTYDNTHYKNHFTIRDDGNVGINNGNPEAKLVVEGDAKINGSVNTSNIIGTLMSTSNILRINYKENYNNNKLEIYGDTTFNGNIITSSTIYATEMRGAGSNITHINANNVNTGILKGVNGGTGINIIRQGEILFGDVNNNARQTQDFFYNPINNTLYVLEFAGRGANIKELNANNITTGRLPVSRGGTNMSKYEVSGGILIGNINSELEISQINKLTWNNQNNYLNVDGNIRLATNSNIYIDSEKLTYKHIGIYPTATSNAAGIIKWDEKIFEINNSNQLSLKNINRNSKWGQASSAGSTEEPEIIYYPTALPFNNKCVGIGTVPEISPFYRLHVDGDINLTNGRYKINGADINAETSNLLVSKIDELTLDKINVNYGGNNKRCFQIFPRTTANGTVYEYNIEGDNDEKFRFKSLVTFEQGIQIDSDLVYSGNLTVSSIEITSGIAGIAGLPVFKVNQLNGDVNSTIAHFLHQNRIQMLLDSEGRLGIGPNFDSDKLPKEKLDVEGNIIVSGHITSYYSDERLKNFTSNITNSLEIINKLTGYYYEPNEKALEHGFKFEKQIGLSAQEVQKVLPEITKLAPFDTVKDGEGNSISKSGENYLTICYERLGPVFIEAIKELTREIKELKIENAAIKKELENIQSKLPVS
jgi:hypothetical protein